MIGGFINFLQRAIQGTGFGFGTLVYIIGAATGLGLFFMIFRFIKGFNIFN